MSGLADFLLARIAEDEQWARAAVNHTPGREHRDWMVTMAGWVVLADLPNAVIATGPGVRGHR